MTTFTWPTTWVPSNFEPALVPNTRAHTSPYSGEHQVVDLIGARWRVSFELPEGKQSSGPALEAFLGRLHGRVHNVSLVHPLRPVPRGTLRGTPTLEAAVLQGASQIGVTTTIGATLRAGDILGMGGEWLMVAEDVTAGTIGPNGYALTQLVNRVRVGRALGYPLTWDRPACLFKQTADVAPVGYRPRARNALQLEFLETW